MAASILPRWFHQTSASRPRIDKSRNYWRGNRWMIGERDQSCLGSIGQLLNAGGYGSSHFTARIVIESKLHWIRGKPFSHFIRAMAKDYDHGICATIAEVIDAPLDDRLVSERKQRLESAHAAGPSGGQQDCCDVRHEI
jgi:hypothetical protein